MFKPNTLLKVISIIMIVLGILSAIITAISFPLLSAVQDVPGVDPALIEQSLSPLSIAMSVVSVIAMLAAGIFGVRGKNFKGALISMVIYLIISVISTIQAIMTTGFTFFLVTNYILPILYLWGLYQSKE